MKVKLEIEQEDLKALYTCFKQLRYDYFCIQDYDEQCKMKEQEERIDLLIKPLLEEKL